MSKSAKIALSLLVVFICSMSVRSYYRSEYYASSKAVKLILDGVGQCSGEQIIAPSGHAYILSAGHCKDLKGDKNSITVELDNGTRLERAVIAEDLKSDLLLLEGIPDASGLSIADDMYFGEHVRTYTHGHGFPTYESQGRLIADSKIRILLGFIGVDFKGDCQGAKYQILVQFGPNMSLLQACVLSVSETVATAFIVPGSSGGMVVNDSGELVGVVSATDGAFSYFVSLDDIKSFLEGY